MKTLCKRLVAAAMTLTLALGLAVPAMAYTTPDFADLPANNWAYAPVMRMADQGIIQGTGGGNFSPELKVSAAQFLTLVGRIVFPETKVSEGDTWYGPYVAAAQSNGLLTGTQVDVNQPEGEISRYDMAVILRAAAKKLGKAETLAQQSQVTDYGVIPNMYTEAVLAVYGMGLIKGDQAGKFNGGNTMQRNELATVIDRLVALKGSGATTEPEQQPDPEKPEPAPHVELLEASGRLVCGKEEDSRTGVESGVPIKIFYTEDNGKTSTLMAEGKTQLSVLGSPGRFDVSFEADINLLERENGRFYVSAEYDYEGEHYVTPDLRTDGNPAIVPIDVHGGTPDNLLQYQTQEAQRNIYMVPPSGTTRNIQIEGGVRCYWDMPPGVQRDENGNIISNKFTISDIPIRLYMTDWSGKTKLLGETVTDEEGKYTLDIDIDVTDYAERSKRYWLETDETISYQGKIFRVELGKKYPADTIEVLQAGWLAVDAKVDFTFEEVKTS